ncbi:hypothetical protein HK405_006389 [Cladochytrium tenue]|nr:hypothetical protein HK405_006389 [Cladochytrium tenue]
MSCVATANVSGVACTAKGACKATVPGSVCVYTTGYVTRESGPDACFTCFDPALPLANVALDAAGAGCAPNDQSVEIQPMRGHVPGFAAAAARYAGLHLALIVAVVLSRHRSVRRRAGASLSALLAAELLLARPALLVSAAMALLAAGAAQRMLAFYTYDCGFHDANMSALPASAALFIAAAVVGLIGYVSMGLANGRVRRLLWYVEAAPAPNAVVGVEDGLRKWAARWTMTEVEKAGRDAARTRAPVGPAAAMADVSAPHAVPLVLLQKAAAAQVWSAGDGAPADIELLEGTLPAPVTLVEWAVAADVGGNEVTAHGEVLLLRGVSVTTWRILYAASILFGLRYVLEAAVRRRWARVKATVRIA